MISGRISRVAGRLFAAAVAVALLLSSAAAEPQAAADDAVKIFRNGTDNLYIETAEEGKLIYNGEEVLTTGSMVNPSSCVCQLTNIAWMLRQPTRRYMHNDEDEVRYAIPSPSGNTLVTFSNKQLSLWGPSSGIQQTSRSFPAASHSLAFLSENIVFMAGLEVNGVVEFNIQQQTSRGGLTIFGHQNIVRDIAIAPNGEFIVTGSEDTSIRIVILATNSLQETFGHDSAVLAVDVSPDSQLIACGLLDYEAMVYGTKGSSITSIFQHTNSVTDVKFLGNTQVITGSWDNTAVLWNITGAQKVRTFASHSPIYAIDVDPVNRLLVTGHSTEIRIWNIDTGNINQVYPISNHVVGLYISGDKKWIYSSHKGYAAQFPLML